MNELVAGVVKFDTGIARHIDQLAVLFRLVLLVVVTIVLGRDKKTTLGRS